MASTSQTAHSYKDWKANNFLVDTYLYTVQNAPIMGCINYQRGEQVWRLKLNKQYGHTISTLNNIVRSLPDLVYMAIENLSKFGVDPAGYSTLENHIAAVHESINQVDSIVYNSDESQAVINKIFTFTHGSLAEKHEGIDYSVILPEYLTTLTNFKTHCINGDFYNIKILGAHLLHFSDDILACGRVYEELLIPIWDLQETNGSVLPEEIRKIIDKISSAFVSEPKLYLLFLKKYEPPEIVQTPMANN